MDPYALGNIFQQRHVFIQGPQLSPFLQQEMIIGGQGQILQVHRGQQVHVFGGQPQVIRVLGDQPQVIRVHHNQPQVIQVVQNQIFPANGPGNFAGLQLHAPHRHHHDDGPHLHSRRHRY